MPNYGGVYRGCSACRQKKKKCDQTYPACKRCVSRGETCPGVPAAADVMFRHQTSTLPSRAVVNGSQKAASPSSSSPSSAQDNDQDYESGSNAEEQVRQKSQRARLGTSVLRIANLVEPAGIDLPQSLHPSLENVAEFHFFSKIVTSIGWLSYVPEVYSSSPEGSPLRKLVGAASLSVLAKQRKDAALFVTARNANGIALRALNRAIGDQGQYLQDDVLFAVGLCRITCILQGDPGTTSRTHSLGLQSLLRHRLRMADTLQTTDAVVELIRSVKAELPVLLLHTQDPIALDNDADESSFWDCTSTCECERRIALLCSDVGEVLRQFNQPRSKARYDVYTTLTHALELDAKLVSWTAGWAPLAWSAHLDHAMASGLWPSRPGYFFDMQVATFWTHLQAARVLLLECIASMCVELLRQSRYTELDLDNIHSKAVKTIDEMVYWICYCIPVHLYSIGTDDSIQMDSPNVVAGAAGIVWPLQVVLRSVSAKEKYKEQARETLEKLRNEYGIGQAKTTLENCHHLGHWSTLP